MSMPSSGDGTSPPSLPRLPVATDTARQPTFLGLVGRGPAMQDVFAAMRRFAPHARLALISGEVGTGKAVVARALHQLGPRRGGPFVELRCSTAIDGATLRAAFDTGEPAADAAQGTVFMDDIDELPWPLQSMLLDLLDAAEAQSRLRPHGGPHVIAATTRDLRTEVAWGRFRADLFYRLSAFELRLPLLRDRLDDMARLAARFTLEAGQRLGRPSPQVTGGAVRLLQTLSWPGNLRELRNVIERACILGDDAILTERDIRAALRQAPPIAERGGTAAAGPSRRDDDTGTRARSALDRVHGNKSAAARDLGISRRSFYRLLDRQA